MARVLLWEGTGMNRSIVVIALMLVVTLIIGLFSDSVGFFEPNNRG